MVNTNIEFLVTLGKLETQTWGMGVSNFKFFCILYICIMIAIFQFFHNGPCQYSISINTWKTWDPNFVGGLIIWNFSIWCIFTKWQPFFDFCIMANTNILLLSTLGNQRPKLWGGVVNWNFSVQYILTKWQPCFDFFRMVEANIPFPSTLRKPETQTLRGLVIWKFYAQCIFMKWWPFFNFFLMVNTDTQFLSILRKSETQIWGLVGSLYKCQITDHLLFSFFYNGWHQCSISIDTLKTEVPDFGWLVIWNFSVQFIFMKW